MEKKNKTLAYIFCQNSYKYCIIAIFAKLNLITYIGTECTFAVKLF